MEIQFHHRIASANRHFVQCTELTRALRNTRGTSSRHKRLPPGALCEILKFIYSCVALAPLTRTTFALRPDSTYARRKLHLYARGFAAQILHIPLLLKVTALPAKERFTNGKSDLKALSPCPVGVSDLAPTMFCQSRCTCQLYPDSRCA